MKLLFLLVLVQCVLLGAERSITASDVVELVFTSLNSDHDDKRLAHDLHKLKMAEQLNPHVVFYFQYLGVGPNSLAELQRLRDESARLEPPVDLPLAIQPVPASDVQNEIVQRIKQYAQSYARSLPNFLCDQVTHRYTNLTGFQQNGNPLYSDDLHLSDRFTLNLRFVDGLEEAVIPHHPHHHDVQITTRKGQSISSGEFGSDINIVFGSGIDPAVHWDHWEMFKRKRTAVFAYFLGLPKSQFTLAACCAIVPGLGERRQTVKASVRGLVYVDPATGVISRLALQPVSLPQAFEIKESQTIIDYADVKIGVQSYNLPVKAVTFIRGRIDGDNSESQRYSPMQKNRNEIAFINYRKFQADSVLTFSHSKITYDTSSQK